MTTTLQTGARRAEGPSEIRRPRIFGSELVAGIRERESPVAHQVTRDASKENGEVTSVGGLERAQNIFLGLSSGLVTYRPIPAVAAVSPDKARHTGSTATDSAVIRAATSAALTCWAFSRIASSDRLRMAELGAAIESPPST